jgi:hypothetical protein
MFNPAWFWEVLSEFFLTQTQTLTFLIKDNCSAACCTLVNAQYVFLVGHENLPVTSQKLNRWQQILAIDLLILAG